MQVERVLAAVAAHDCPPEQAARWAAQWVYVTAPQPMPAHVWAALLQLAGCDLRFPDGSYLHEAGHVAHWLAVFRQSTGRGARRYPVLSAAAAPRP